MREELILELPGFKETHEYQACSYLGMVMLRVSLSLPLFSVLLHSCPLAET